MSALVLANEHLILSPDNGLIAYMAERLEDDIDELIADEDLMKFFSSKKAPKKKSSGMESAKALSEINEEKCQARIWQKADPDLLSGSGYNQGNTGYAVQCGSKSVDGCFCKRCGGKDDLPFGKVTEKMPVDEEHSLEINEKMFWILNDENGHIFNISDLPEKKKKSGGRPKKSDDEKDKIILELERRLAQTEGEDEQVQKVIKKKKKKDQKKKMVVKEKEKEKVCISPIKEDSPVGHEIAPFSPSVNGDSPVNDEQMLILQEDSGDVKILKNVDGCNSGVLTFNGKKYKYDEDGLVYEIDDEDEEDPLGTFDPDLMEIDM